uniref:Uncharacterized protein n=1 Tax=Arundo donax TaxID=35708 RepID=A0A0A9GBF6_ARUDO
MRFSWRPAASPPSTWWRRACSRWPLCSSAAAL